jgi:transmembrane sensor
MNTNHDNISEELLARYFNKTATATELGQIREWVESSPANARALDAFKIIWEKSGDLSQQKKFDTDLAWSKVRIKIAPGEIKPVASETAFVAPERKISSLSTRKTLPLTLWAAAAVALLVMTFGWFQFQKEQKPVILSLTTQNNVTETYLPDGTKVFLNYNSSLSYPQNFDGDFRSVSLKGEAFFDVKPDATHPFVIDANGTEIKVLGTSFNVKAYSKQPVRVDVATGKVLVRKAKNEINLVKGQSAEVVNDTVRSIIPDVNLMGYRTQIFDFNATELNAVVSSIRDGYHADIRLSSDQIARCRLTIRFEKEPLDATLSVIAETLHLQIRKEGKTYWFEGTGCQ